MENKKTNSHITNQEKSQVYNFFIVLLHHAKAIKRFYSNDDGNDKHNQENKGGHIQVP